MSGIFAKLFDHDGTQILVQMEENDDGHPSVQFKTELNGLRVSLGLVFSGKDVDRAWDAAEDALNNCELDQAIDMYNSMNKSTSQFLSGQEMTG